MKQEDFIPKKVFLVGGLFVLFILFLLFNPLVSVPAGTRGIRLSWGAAVEMLEPGLHFRMPIKDNIKFMTIQTQKTEIDADAVSMTLQSIITKIAVNYHVSEDGVLWLYKNIGTDFKGRIIDPAIEESVKAATAQYSTQDLIDRRPDVSRDITNNIKAKMNTVTKGYLIIDQVNVVNFAFSSSYQEAIDAKARAEQETQEQRNILEKIKVQAQQTIEEAEGKAQARIKEAYAEAEAVRLINEQLKQSPAYIELKYAEAAKNWDGKLPTYMIGGGSLPLIQLPTPE